jgi:hypothetical protein
MNNEYERSKLHPGHVRENVSCPGCGYEYGAYRRMACRNCEECSQCCSCSAENKDLVTATALVAELHG